jgi:hypothetical protein
MDTYVRRGLIGLLAGILSGVILANTLPDQLSGLLLGIVVGHAVWAGMVVSWSFDPHAYSVGPCRHLDHAGGRYTLAIIAGSCDLWSRDGPGVFLVRKPSCSVAAPG